MRREFATARMAMQPEKRGVLDCKLDPGIPRRAHGEFSEQQPSELVQSDFVGFGCGYSFLDPLSFSARFREKARRRRQSIPSGQVSGSKRIARDCPQCIALCAFRFRVLREASRAGRVTESGNALGPGSGGGFFLRNRICSDLHSAARLRMARCFHQFGRQRRRIPVVRDPRSTGDWSLVASRRETEEGIVSSPAKAKGSLRGDGSPSAGAHPTASLASIRDAIPSSQESSNAPNRPYAPGRARRAAIRIPRGHLLASRPRD
jgi:hypothetical protein